MASFIEYTKNYTSPVNGNMRTLGNFYKMAMIDKAMNIKTENPKMTKKDIAKNLDVSERTLQRYSNDIIETMFEKKKIKLYLKIHRNVNIVILFQRINLV